MTRMPTAELLEQLYHQKGMSLQAIGDRYGVAKSTVSRWMDDRGIERRGPGRRSECPPMEDLARLAARGWKVRRLADYYSCSEPTMRKYLEQCGIAVEEGTRGDKTA